MKTLLLAAVISAIGLAGCSTSEPGYSSRQRVYTDPYGYNTSPYYDPAYNNGYRIERVYDYNTGRYYDVPVYNAPVYGSRPYSSPYPEYRRNDNRYSERNRYNDRYNDQYRRYNDQYRNNSRREYPVQQPANEQRVEQPKEKRLPDGTRVTSDGTVILPNGQVKKQ